ncbi:hypothetical protein ACIQUS_25595 [Pseudomonas sp. NPDC090755]|uniref:hypothetical protein n=1 Tax=Pseudomonas sp. NPDC090755 TaxID=3364481 RepID=UPI00383AE121
MSKVIVIFEKNWRGYAAGETAGFDASVADGLVAAGFAIEADKKASKKPKAGVSGTAGTGGADDRGADGKPGAEPDTDGKP